MCTHQRKYMAKCVKIELEEFPPNKGKDKKQEWLTTTAEHIRYWFDGKANKVEVSLCFELEGQHNIDLLKVSGPWIEAVRVSGIIHNGNYDGISIGKIQGKTTNGDPGVLLKIRVLE